MRPWFYKLLSYFWDIQIDYRHSLINGDLVVFLVKGRYQLCTANAIYSFEDKYDNFGNVFREYIDLSKLPGNRVLILGLGLGSVPLILDMINPGKWSFSSVEIDPEICELASLYAYPKIKSPITTIIGDASSFVKTCTEQFDLICIDLFIDEDVPENCSSLAFLNDVQSCLAPGGLIVNNTLAFTKSHKESANEYYQSKFKKVFREASLIHTHKNFMLLSDISYLKTEIIKR